MCHKTGTEKKGRILFKSLRYVDLADVCVLKYSDQSGIAYQSNLFLMHSQLRKYRSKNKFLRSLKRLHLASLRTEVKIRI